MEGRSSVAACAPKRRRAIRQTEWVVAEDDDLVLFCDDFASRIPAADTAAHRTRPMIVEVVIITSKFGGFHLNVLARPVIGFSHRN